MKEPKGLYQILEPGEKVFADITETFLLKKILEEQRKTNQLLLMLVEALGEETEQDEEPSTYLDGTPAR